MADTKRGYLLPTAPPYMVSYYKNRTRSTALPSTTFAIINGKEERRFKQIYTRLIGQHERNVHFKCFYLLNTCSLTTHKSPSRFQVLNHPDQLCPSDVIVFDLGMDAVNSIILHWSGLYWNDGACAVHFADSTTMSNVVLWVTQHIWWRTRRHMRHR